MAQVSGLGNGRMAAPDGALAARLRRDLEGGVLFHPFDRGRYTTDASIYQVTPIGVVLPRSEEDVRRTRQIAAEFGVPLLPRGGGTSQAGQAVGEALVVDHSRHLNRVLDFDPEGRSVWVEPGVVLDDLNRFLRPHGMFFPVDISTGSRATIGGMAGNNACGSRSLRYGIMVDNVRAIDAVLADGTRARFEEVPGNLDGLSGRYLELVQRARAIAAREAEEIRARYPKVQRSVGGYNLDRVDPAGRHNMAKLLVGSEGTLALFTRIQLDLQPLPRKRVLGVCRFPTFRRAMESAQHIVKLGPTAVELVDRTIIELARQIPEFQDTIAAYVWGEPDALLLVEFAGDDLDAQERSLRALQELMGDLGLPGAVIEANDPAEQARVWEVRKAGLNIVMSMKGDGKPVSFIEDCAVPLEHLADYTERLTEVFRRHGTTGTWYAHASVGCLHVRPILNLKQEEGARTLRAIAEEALALVRTFKGAFSGEHGDGMVRSWALKVTHGPRVAHAFEEVKNAFDPRGLLNPGKIVRPPQPDDRTLFRYKPGYGPLPLEEALDWSEWGGFLGAVEMCNNNGACRKAEPGVMCPSYRVTREERDVTRGRANTLRLALTGQLGPEALTSDALYDTLALCVACKGCKRECPTGVDMARMKTEFLHHYYKRHRRSLKERLIAYLPRYAPLAARADPLLNLRDRLPGAPALSERLLGFNARRPLPRWHRRPFRLGRDGAAEPAGDGRDVVLLVDTFNTWFEPDNARAALRVLRAAGYRVHGAAPRRGRPLCCGRTFLAGGLVEEARAEARRTVEALKPYVARGVPVVGLEPSCLLTLRDEFAAVLPGADTEALAARALLLEEFFCREREAGRLALPLKPTAWRRALLHGHCHQKAHGTMGAVEGALRLVPELEVAPIASSCCGMAGSFGYAPEHHDVSMRMAELSLLPAVRGAGPDTVVVADGTSCRQQIKDGAGREALHVARVLEAALADG